MTVTDILRDPYLNPSKRTWRFAAITDEALEQQFLHVDEESLKKRNFHVFPVSKIMQQCSNPLGCWAEQETAIHPSEIQACLDAGEEALVDTPLWTEVLFRKTVTVDENRKRHIQKVAFFVKNPPSEPISIDVGAPSLGYYSSHLVDDGNHRLAGCHLGKVRFMAVHVGGEVSEAKRRGLWNPTPEAMELERREMLAFEKKRKRRPQLG